MRTKYGNVDLDGRSEHNDGLVTGLLLGAVIGACAALLFAPKSGKSIREDIKHLAGKKANKLDRTWEKAKDKAGDAKDAFDSAAGDAESKLKDFANKAENEAEDGVETVIDKFQKKY